MVKNIESEDFMSWECLNRNIRKKSSNLIHVGNLSDTFGQTVISKSRKRNPSTKLYHS